MTQISEDKIEYDKNGNPHKKYEFIESIGFYDENGRDRNFMSAVEHHYSDKVKEMEWRNLHRPDKNKMDFQIFTRKAASHKEEIEIIDQYIYYLDQGIIKDNRNTKQSLLRLQKKLYEWDKLETVVMLISKAENECLNGNEVNNNYQKTCAYLKKLSNKYSKELEKSKFDTKAILDLKSVVDKAKLESKNVTNTIPKQNSNINPTYKPNTNVNNITNAPKANYNPMHVSSIRSNDNSMINLDNINPNIDDSYI